jgi:branched-chain amino acid transport system substrate-binding protein
MGAASAVVFAMAMATSAHAQVSDDVVKIGVLNDMAGPYSAINGEGSNVAVRMAVEDFGGKVLGKPIEIVIADHQNKADVGSSIARRWFDEEKVDVVTNLSNSSVALAVQSLARDKSRIVLHTAPASSDLTGKSCSPTGFHWVYDTYALASGTGKALVKQGGDTWFFITADYAFGHALERDTSAFVTEAGGKVLGSVRAPLNTADFSSFLLQAQASGAKVIGLANAGTDTTNVIKQAAEFGIVKGGQRLAGLLVFISDIHALGLEAAQGLVITTAYYWDQNDETRAWDKRFRERFGKPATMLQAGDYSAVTHYLKAVKAAGTDEAKAVAAKMRELPVNDFMSKNVKIREDGRVMRDMYLVQVKTPAESKGPWDVYKVLATIPGNEAYRPLDKGGCPYVK